MDLSQNRLLDNDEFKLHGLSEICETFQKTKNFGTALASVLSTSHSKIYILKINFNVNIYVFNVFTFQED
jgi:hypothetical protein